MTPKSVLLIVPTRGRPQKSLEFFEAFKKNSSITDLVFGLDDDDIEYPRIPGVIYEVNPRAMMNGTLNLIANKYASQYDYIAFMGDDHRIRTNEWDVKLVDSIKNLKNGMAYGNDLLQGQTLPTAVLIDSNIVKILGFMAPPKQKHLYLDNFWLDLGTSLKTIRYHSDVIIEHVHFTNNKTEKDNIYEEVNSVAIFNHDETEYRKYVEHQMQSDLEKLRASSSQMEWKLFDGETCEYAQAKWYSDRAAAHHLDEPGHSERIFKTLDVIKHAINLGAKTLVDFGCGDGGLLQLLKTENINSWGYDLMPDNVDYAVNVRKVDVRYTDFTNDPVEHGDISVFTEVLEHMINPHKIIQDLSSKFIVASSPYHETNLNHYEFHLWAWNMDGYKALLENNGYKVIASTTALGWCQILLGVKESELSWWMK